MDIQRINQHTSAFNDITHYIESDNGKEKIEVWFARELQSVLGYVRWENFTIAIGRAVESCKSQNINVDDHFREVTKMISLGSPSITAEHVQNNVSVRQMLGQRGIKPENLPPAEDIKKVERRVASNEKKIEKTSNKLPKKVE